MLDDRKLWFIGGGSGTRARDRRECVSREEAVELANLEHEQSGHWHRDVMKLALLDRYHSPKLDESIIKAIMDCARCKNFGAPKGGTQEELDYEEAGNREWGNLALEGSEEEGPSGEEGKGNAGFFYEDEGDGVPEEEESGIGARLVNKIFIQKVKGSKIAHYKRYICERLKKITKNMWLGSEIQLTWN
ncbi:hypothetical protein K443DRAFT_122711 [Laccaria amethystina LaAM-08-1]|uniref:Uncharacterized protein n=1 Tax=Laccaria amethystina LaAM-08-1 TaxID=1095629 RepID=A0A0C9XXX0_9AGAR|nr:hypothetical protein K443DRAFT_122711 [Laccaria amethystina LaAM-08-1]